MLPAACVPSPKLQVVEGVPVGQRVGATETANANACPAVPADGTVAEQKSPQEVG